MPSFRVDITDALEPGKNQLEIKITNQWSNKLIGDERFIESYPGYKLEGNFPKGKMLDWYVNNEPMPKGQRTTFCTASFYEASDPLMSSGLLGPVKIKVNKRLVLDLSAYENKLSCFHQRDTLVGFSQEYIWDFICQVLLLSIPILSWGIRALSMQADSASRVQFHCQEY